MRILLYGRDDRMKVFSVKERGRNDIESFMNADLAGSDVYKN